jgi:hypothetical protein
MRLRPLPGHIPTQFQAWRAGHQRGFVVACAIFSAMFLLLGSILSRIGSQAEFPPADRTFAVTAIDMRAPDSPPLEFRLDDVALLRLWNGNLADGMRASGTARVLARDGRPTMEVGQIVSHARRIGGPIFPRVTQGHECRVIALADDATIDVSECLAPVAGRR